MSKRKYFKEPPTQEESEQEHRDSMDHAFGRADHLDNSVLTGAIEYSDHSNLCKTDNRTLDKCDATLVSFDRLKHTTQEHDVGIGALLLVILDKEVWLPKKLCSNLNLTNMTVRVWTVFLKDKKPELYDLFLDNEEE